MYPAVFAACAALMGCKFTASALEEDVPGGHPTADALVIDASVQVIDARPDGGTGGSDAGSTGGSDAGSTGGSDAGSTGGSDAGTSAGNTVTCYRTNDPAATCALPAEHCCFSNYSAAHDGACSTTSCAWGTIRCDGPEDCGTGQRCCAHALIDPNDGLFGHALTCQATPCGPAPVNQQICHTTSQCPAGTQCVTVVMNDNDLPRTLNICK
jgi:hypothetical protein